MADYQAWRKWYIMNTAGDAVTDLWGIGAGQTSFWVSVLGDDPAWEKAVEAIFVKHGVKRSPSLTWLFKEQGLICINKAISGLSEETITLYALGAGATDVIFDDGDWVDIICAPNRLAEIKDVLLFEDVVFQLAEVIKVPKDLVGVYEDKACQSILDLMEDLSSCPWVRQVTADFYLPDKWV